MRTLSLFVMLAGCGDASRNNTTTFLKDLSVGGASGDMSVSTSTDMANPSPSPSNGCNPVDPMNDGAACGSGCPAGQVGVSDGVNCKCWLKCDPATPSQCPCDRRCASLTSGDMGVVGGACLVANSAGQRCGQTGGAGLNAEGCAQNLLCVNADDAGNLRYCVYDCTGGGACPAGTTCTMLNGVATSACVWNTVSSGGVAAGAACSATMQCNETLLCDTTCKTQCDRTGATCASGACTAVTDGSKTVGYVCK